MESDVPVGILDSGLRSSWRETLWRSHYRRTPPVFSFRNLESQSGNSQAPTQNLSDTLAQVKAGGFKIEQGADSNQALIYGPEDPV